MSTVTRPSPDGVSGKEQSAPLPLTGLATPFPIVSALALKPVTGSLSVTETAQVAALVGSPTGELMVTVGLVVSCVTVTDALALLTPDRPPLPLIT
jgi:hypothetical protein